VLLYQPLLQGTAAALTQQATDRGDATTADAARTASLRHVELVASASVDDLAHGRLVHGLAVADQQLRLR
jgi:hypothetical protein